MLLIVLTGLAFTAPAGARDINLVRNPGFESAVASPLIPDGYDLGGAASWGRAGEADQFTTQGIIFPGDAKEGGSVGQIVRGIDQSKGRWLTFRFRGLAEDGFVVDENALAMKIDFYSRNGSNFLDGATRLIYREVSRHLRHAGLQSELHPGIRQDLPAAAGTGLESRGEGGRSDEQQPRAADGRHRRGGQRGRFLQSV